MKPRVANVSGGLSRNLIRPAPPVASLAILLVVQGAAYGIFIISRRDTYVFSLT
jgi:hypothetical protein